MSTKSSRSAGSQFTKRGPTQGNTLVDPVRGLPVAVVEDGDGVLRLAVDSLATIEAQEIVVDVNLDSSNDEVALEDPDTGAHVRVEPDGSINTNIESDAADGDNIAISSHPNQVFSENADTITSAAFEEIFSFTAFNDNTRIMLVEASVSTPSTVRLKLNGDIIKLKRTSSLERNAVFEFREHRNLDTGDTLTVEAQTERFIFSSYDTFTSLEGYVV